MCIKIVLATTVGKWYSRVDSLSFCPTNISGFHKLVKLVKLASFTNENKFKDNVFFKFIFWKFCLEGYVTNHYRKPLSCDEKIN